MSFEPNPNWSREYPGQEEIHEYLIDVAHKYKLYKHIRFNTEVEEAEWNEATNTWQTKIIRNGGKEAEFGQRYTITSDFLVSAVGQLNIPKYPEILGLESFQGKVMHSARWDWDYDLRSKKIGIIGVGASSVQIVPELAKVCESLTVFQRTPSWMVPRGDSQISPAMRLMYNHLPFLRRRYRGFLMSIREGTYDAIVDPTSPLADDFMNLSKLHLSNQLPGDENAALCEQLTPRYHVGCKRILISDDYFPVFRRPNVNLETDSIQSITPNGVQVTNTHHDLDLLVLATGFKSTQFMYPIRIRGSNGISIDEIWSSGASAYLGMTVPNLPNFAMLYGPNTNLGHNSIILMIEAQSMYINTLISATIAARKAGKTLRLEPKQAVLDQYNKEIQHKLRNSAFADPKCNSWYKNEAGLITNNWCGTVIEYQKKTQALKWADYEVDGSAKGDLKDKKWGRVIEENIIPSAVLTGLGSVLLVGLTGLILRSKIIK